jgi:hypothetical protein
VGTTSVASLWRVIAALQDADCDFALLHGADALEDGLTDSDLDIMIALPPSAVLAGIEPILRASGLMLIFVWESDGGTVNTFWWSSDDNAGCQVDMLYDPKGTNRFGFKTNAAWAHVDKRSNPPRLNDIGLSTYLLGKRLAKGQVAEYEHLRVCSGPVDGNLLATRTRLALRVPPSRTLVRWYGAATRWRSRVIRLNARLRGHQGVVVHLSIDDARDEDFVLGLTKVLPRVRTVHRLSLITRTRVALLPELALVRGHDGQGHREVLPELSSRARQRIASLNGGTRKLRTPAQSS